MQGPRGDDVPVVMYYTWDKKLTIGVQPAKGAGIDHIVTADLDADGDLDIVFQAKRNSDSMNRRK